ncbi:hypothetical protein QBC44DRAFT_329775 [Cladorrhinum sp. PSN332]|nr:hypothetical protein QBC44DRAFT_329775 [Cladorrhinum sp. PSN332]
MDLPDEPEAYLVAESWVRQLDAGDNPIDNSSVAVRLVSEDLKCLKIVLKHVGLPDSEVPAAMRKGLEQCYSRLVLWADGYGVEQGELNEAMARSRSLRRAITEILVSIGRTVLDKLANQLCIAEEKIDRGALQAAIQDALFVLDDGCEDSDSDESQSDSSIYGADPVQKTAPDLNEVVKELDTDTQCLLDLDPLIKSAVPDPVANERQYGKLVAVDWAPHTVFSDRVSRRFPTADASLVESLAKANLDRFLRARDEREAGRLAQEVSRIAAGAAALLKDSGAADPSEGGTKFHDSGLGTSIATPSSYAETVMSYREGESFASVRIPPLPEGAKNGKDFECIACGRVLVITNNSAWKKHLFLDLRPWLCLDLACASRGIPFSTREDWVQHLAYEHEFAPEWQSIDCPLCIQPTPNGKIPLLRHLGSHLEEISLGSLPACLDPETASESGSSSDPGSVSSNVSGSDPTVVVNSPPNSSPNSTLKIGLIHELAVQDRRLEELRLSLGVGRWDSRRLEVILNTVAEHDTQSQKWSLGKGFWKTLDIFAYNFRPGGDRQKAVENAINQYDSMGIPPQDPLWQKLLPRKDRGKGICLSKLKPATPDNHSSAPQPEAQTRDAVPPHKSKSASSYHCLLCNSHPEGFQQEHELQRHTDIHHTRTVKKWICRDPFLAGIPSKAIAVRPLSGCPACSSMKPYGFFYNAVAHLRRMHFTDKDNSKPRYLRNYN